VTIPKPGAVMGRPKIFTSNNGARTRVQGGLTPVGTSRFEGARKRLAKLVGRDPEFVSDADVIEYLARGESATRLYLEKGSGT
jgi:hypothetical protein